MEFNRNSDVFTKNNSKVGPVNRIVIDPGTKEVTHLVIDKGFLFSDDRLVPISLVETAEEDRIQLSVNEEELDNMQKFEETFHVSSPQVERLLGEGHPRRARRYILYPPYGANWWVQGGYPLPPYVTHTARYTPEGTVALEEGASVIASDDENIGEVESLLTDKSENRVTHLVVSQGLLFKRKFLVPSTWISMVKEDGIHLSVDSELTNLMPEIESEKS